MSGVYPTVAAAYLYALPVLMGLLALTALRRDRLSFRVCFAVTLGFGLALGLDTIAAPFGDDTPGLPPGALWLWPASAVALAIRLVRDRRQHHRRSVVESLAVLGVGAILLGALLSLPVFLAPA